MASVFPDAEIPVGQPTLNVLDVSLLKGGKGRAGKKPIFMKRSRTETSLSAAPKLCMMIFMCLLYGMVMCAGLLLQKPSLQALRRATCVFSVTRGWWVFCAAIHTRTLTNLFQWWWQSILQIFGLDHGAEKKLSLRTWKPTSGPPEHIEWGNLNKHGGQAKGTISLINSKS